MTKKSRTGDCPKKSLRHTEDWRKMKKAPGRKSQCIFSNVVAEILDGNPLFLLICTLTVHTNDRYRAISQVLL